MNHPILFLDIDGVLNGHEKYPDSPYTTIRPDCIAHLNAVVKATDCRIVISSAWRYMLIQQNRRHKPPMTLMGFGYMMHTHGLTRASSLLIGHTRADEECWKCGHRHRPGQLDFSLGDGTAKCQICVAPVNRGWQIWRWLLDNGPVERYAVVDDLPASEFGDHPFVRTNPAKGLTASSVRKLINILGS